MASKLRPHHLLILGLFLLLTLTCHVFFSVFFMRIVNCGVLPKLLGFLQSNEEEEEDCFW